MEGDNDSSTASFVFRQYTTLRIDSRDDGLDVVTLARPPMNPLSTRLILELSHYFTRLRTDLSTRVVILRSASVAGSHETCSLSRFKLLGLTSQYIFCVVVTLRLTGGPGFFCGPGPQRAGSG